MIKLPSDHMLTVMELPADYLCAFSTFLVGCEKGIVHGINLPIKSVN